MLTAPKNNIMIKNYFKIALRNLWKRKAFTSINIIGLSIAFAIAMLLGMTALFDLSFDKFHTNIANIYKVYTTEQTSKGAEASTSHPVPFSVALKKEVPGIKHISRYNGGPIHVAYKSKELNMSVATVDEDFFNIFTFPTILGNKNNIQKKFDVAITEDAATKLFGRTNVIGETVMLTITDKAEPFIVSSVLKNFPQNSTIQFDMAVNFENNSHFISDADRWNSASHEVFLQLNNQVDKKLFEKNTVSFTNLHFKNNIEEAKRDGVKANTDGLFRQIRLMPFKDEHFSKFEGGVAKPDKIRTYVILGISLLILFIACVNFINMSIGTSVQRLREIGMRKTLGALKQQLFFQFWGESIIVFLSSLIFGGLLSWSLVDKFKTTFRINASFSDLTTPVIVIGFCFTFFLITLIAGGYPAYLLSKFNTLQSLKGKLTNIGKNRLRNSLIVIQFSIAALLITGTLVLWSQLKFMQTKNLGFNKEQVIAFPLNGKLNKRQSLQLLRNELQNKPGIISVSASDNILGRGKDGSAYTSNLGFDHKGRVVKTNMLVVDYDYIETLDIKLKEGRNFNRKFGNDSMSIVINEAMAKELEEKNPLNASIYLDSVKHSIIGVLSDYHFQGLNKKIEPITMFLRNDWDLYFAYVKIAPENIVTGFETVKNAWAKVEPNVEFMGSFLDENIDRTFRQEKIMTTIITSGAIIAILLSCMGLFAISLLVVAQRTKEIGIRKVVGASVATIALMLSKDFLKLVFIALLIATPLSWLLMNKALQSYAYRINLSAWYFIVAGLAAIFIALLTIGFRTIKAALANPVHALKSE